MAKVNGKTLDGYLKSRGDDFVRDWPDDAKKARAYFVVRFNQKNKKGLQITETKSSKYKMIFQVKSLDMGNGGSSFIPFASAKAGGVIVSGLIEIINQETDKSVCCLEVDDVKGVGHPSETVRLGMAYFDLASKVLKEAKKAGTATSFEETTRITSGGGTAVVAGATKAVKATAKSTAKAATTKKTASAKKTVKKPVVEEADDAYTEIMAVLSNAKGQEFKRRRKPVAGNFSNIANQREIGAYLDFSDADIDGRSEEEFIRHMESTADGRDLDSGFGEKWESSMKKSFAATVTSTVNKELKDEKIRLRFSTDLTTEYVLKMEVVSVDDDGNNKINYLFVNMKTGEVEAQITCESKGGHFGRYVGLLQQGFESAGEDFSEMLIDQID